jgi:hypothetical protein
MVLFVQFDASTFRGITTAFCPWNPSFFLIIVAGMQVNFAKSKKIHHYPSFLH